MELVKGALGRPYSGDNPQPVAFPKGGGASKGGLAMAQAKHQAAIPLREISVPELVSMAIHRRRRMMEKGKTSLRVVVPLPPHLVPPTSGVYSTAMGDVSIKSVFKASEGRWIVTVKLPSDEGFKVAELVKSPNSSQSIQPSPSQQ